MDDDLFAAEEADDIRHLLISARLVLADDLCHGKAGNALDQQNIQQPVVRLRLRGRIEAAAVPATVGDADHRLLVVEDLAVDLDLIVMRNALDDVDAGGERVRAGAGDQRQPLILADRRADARVQTDRADVERIGILLAADQVEGRDVAVEQTVETFERGGVREDLDEIVAGAAGKMRDRGIRIADHAVDDLVERAIAAAGVDADGIARGRRRLRDPGAVARGAGDEDLIGKAMLVAHLADHLGEFAGLVVFACRRVDDK